MNSGDLFLNKLLISSQNKTEVIILKKSREAKKPDLLEDYCPVSSSGDCTGLIPAGVKKEEELEAYQEMYNFLPPPPDSHNGNISADKGKFPDK